MATCGEHAQMIALLFSNSTPDELGPNMRALYDRFMKSEHEECIAPESQVMALIQDALQKDSQKKLDFQIDIDNFWS